MSFFDQPASQLWRGHIQPNDPDEEPYRFTTRAVVVWLFVTYVTWQVCVAAYRVTLHPLSGIPGPKLPAITPWYEIYYDVLLGGKYFNEIKKMHRKYGPIVRINPNEVHFCDPDFIDSVYPTTGRKTDKPIMVGRRSGTPNSIVATVKHDVHRMRRSSISTFFSNASIKKIEPKLKAKLQRTLDRWDQLGRNPDGAVINVGTVFQAFASDVIIHYAFGDCFHFLEDEDWGGSYFASQEKYFALTHIFGHFPIVMAIVHNMPAWAMSMFIPNLSEISEKQQWRLDRVRKIRASPDPNEINSTIFEGILGSNLPENEKTDARMANDAQLIALAGESTTSYTLTAIMFELLSHPEDYKKAREEVILSLPDDDPIPSYTQVQNLPFLKAVIQECLRLHPGVLSRQPRISPEKDIIYHDKKRGATYVIPAGIPTSMSTHISHMDPEAFEDPEKFRPKRWLDNPRLDKALVAFSHGSRNCIGQEFARREMSIIIATILKRYDIYHGQEGYTVELHDTTRERDIIPRSEVIIPMAAKESQGVRVRFRS